MACDQSVSHLFKYRQLQNSGSFLGSWGWGWSSTYTVSGFKKKLFIEEDFFFLPEIINGE